jgi:hypothetical protein
MLFDKNIHRQLCNNKHYHFDSHNCNGEFLGASKPPSLWSVASLWMPIKACDYSMRIDNLKIIKANITQILKREISRINIPQVDKRKIWKHIMRKKSRALCEQKVQQHFMSKKFNSSSRKIIEDHFVNKNSKTSNEQKVSKTHFQKFNCNLWRNNWTSWTSKKIMSPLCLLNFLHVVQRNSTIAKVRMRFELWAPLLRSSMSKDFTQVHHVCKMGKGRSWNKYSWASSLVTWLLQINLILGIYQGLKPNLRFPYWNISLKRPE